jgi:opacity protein-like surface antigen
MKKILSLFVIVMGMATIASAQDIITTVDSQEIKAKILEISSTQVKYVDYNYQDGPVYVFNADEIASITLANGDVKTFAQKVNPESLSVSNNTITQNPYVLRTGNRYYYNGEEMRGEVYANFLKNNCADAYKLYQHGKSVSTAGWILLGVGVGLDIGFAWWLPYSGYIGLACEIACIPTLIVGYTQMHRSAEIYNTACIVNSQAYWSINASQNGIGIALNF